MPYPIKYVAFLQMIFNQMGRLSVQNSDDNVGRELDEGSEFECVFGDSGDEHKENSFESRHNFLWRPTAAFDKIMNARIGSEINQRSLS